MDGHVEQNPADKQAPVDYGVQIRFIDDIKGTNKVKKPKKNLAKSGSYGVVVRVQGISGQPFVVLNNSDGAPSVPGASSRMDYAKGGIHEGSSDALPGTQMQRAAHPKPSEFAMPENPYGDAVLVQPQSHSGSQCTSSDEETGSKCYANVYDSKTYVQNNTHNFPYTHDEGHQSLPRRRPMHQEEQLRKFHSHGSLLISDGVEHSREIGPNYQFLPEERPGFRIPSPAASADGERSVSNWKGKHNGNLDHRHLEKPWTNTAFNSTKPLTKASSVTDISLKSNDVNEIDTKPLSSVDTLISKFDGKGGQQRGRTARRNRISPEDRKRSQSLDRELYPSREAETNSRPATGVNQKPFRSSDIMDIGKDIETARIFEVKSSVVSRESSSPIQFAPQYSSTDKAYTTGFQNKLDKESGNHPSFNSASLPRKWNQNQMEMEPRVEKNPKAAIFAEQDVELKCTPDLLKDQKAHSLASEELTKQLIFSLLKEGSIESDNFLKKKANLVFDKLQGTKYAELSPDLGGVATRKNDLEKKVIELQQNFEEELTKCQQLRAQKDQNKLELQDLRLQLEENIEERTQLHSLYQKNRKELQNNIEDLKKVKMEKDTLEAEMKDLQEEMSLLQKELRTVRKSAGNGGDQETLQELARTKEELDMVATAKQTVEDILRQKERELTALKGVLKEEVSSHDKAMEELTAQYQKDMEQLRKNIDEVSQNQQSVESERQKINSTMRNLQMQLQESTEESSHWKEMFQKNREELRSSKQELMQMKMEKEEYDEELRDLRDRYSTLQGEVDHVKKTSVDIAGMEAFKELDKAKKELKEKTASIEYHEALIQQKEKELSLLKEAHNEKAANHSKVLEELKQNHRKEVEMLRKNCNLMAEEKINLVNEKGVTEQAKKAADSTLKQLRQDNEDLKRRISQMDFQMGECKDMLEEFRSSESRLKDKIARLEVERKQMEESLGEVTDQEQEAAVAKRVLENRLEETQRNLSRVTQDYEELKERFQDELRQKDQLKKAKSELEEQKRLQEKMVEKLQKEIEVISEQSGSSVVKLQSQLEEHRDKSRRELLEHQRQGKEKTLELEKANMTIKRQQDEIGHLKQELQQSNAEKESALLDKDVLGQKVQCLEQEMDTKRRNQDDKSRLAKVLEDKVKRLELELEEEKSSVDLSAERINRSREQIEQLRSELMQERAARQDLECDKISLERQNKDLRTRLANSEGNLKPNANLPQLESRIRELEDRLQLEERERSILQASNRKLERKVKELTIQLDDERQHVSDEKDQLTLRVKALKRQVDEAEEEIERLETARKKSLRELEEVHEANEQLQSRIKSLEKDVWRKNARSNMDLKDDDDLSSDDDFESTFNPSSIKSLITESNLQTSSC
ncbi:cingulin isoform X1 [Hemitrygon akajei]|uniref:cingulin isoform X1 n=1 Tax=Hemitrygon akajei TaxID=2704970 RepID=UPI003BFA1AF2